jgi:ubiquinone/menaquinone biosynthesis C-methylase UbiE
MTQPDPYFLGYRQSEQERLRLQAQGHVDEARALFEEIGVSSGWRVVEVGCGPRGCLDLLAEQVGATGNVVGVERSEDAVTLAQRFIADHQLTNVQVLNADARTSGLPRETFDLATARLVLINVPEPGQIIAEMVGLVRPGGVVAFHEADWMVGGPAMCEPALPAHDRLVDLLETYTRRHGMDLFIGRKVAQMLREAGLVDVRVRPLIYLYPPDHAHRMILIDFVGNLRERLLAENMIGEAELEELTAATKRHLDDPNTLVVSAIFFQVWGRKLVRGRAERGA